MKKKSCVYFSKDINELEKLYKNGTLDVKLDVIDCLRLLEFNDDYFIKMRECYKLELNEKQNNRLNYIQYLYWLHKKDDYNLKKIKKRLKENKFYNNIVFEFCESKTIFDHINIFKNYPLNELKLLYKKNFYKTYIEYIFLESCSENKVDIHKYNYFSKKTLTHIKLLIKKKELTIIDIIYLFQIITIINFYLISKRIIENELFITDKVIEEILEKLSIEKTKYNKLFSKKQMTLFNETILSTYQLLMTKNKPVKNSYNKFFEQNKEVVTSKCIIMNELLNEKKLTKEKIIDLVKEGLSLSEDMNIMNLIMAGSNVIKFSEFDNYIMNLKSILFDRNLNKINTKEFDLALDILEFWNGKKFDYSILDDTIYIDDFLKLLIDFDSDKISYEEFISSISMLNKIFPSIILNWDRVEQIFNKIKSMKWLEIIINKASFDEFDFFKFKNYIENLYVRILNKKKILLISDFYILDELIINSFGEIEFYYLSSIVRINIYKDIDEILEEYLYIVVNNFEKLKNRPQNELSNYIYMIIEYMLIEENSLLKNEVFNIVKKHQLLTENGIILLGISFNDIELLNLNYDKILSNLISIFYSKQINDFDYKIISIISRKTLGINFKCESIKNAYYHGENKNYVLKKVDSSLAELYEKLDITLKEEHDLNYTEEDIIWLLVHKIFFAHIEQKKAGKLIKVPNSAGAKEFIETLEKAIGYDIVKEKINKILKGEKSNQLWFNLFTLHEYFKVIEKMDSNIFCNTKNQLIKNDFFIFHISALILAAKIGLMKHIITDDKVFITNIIYEEINYKYAIDVMELSDGITSERINYDELLDDCQKIVNQKFEEKKVIFVTKANVLGITELDNINQYDSDIFKFFCSNEEASKYFIISEDSCYYEMNGFNERTSGLYSYIIANNIIGQIKDNELLEYTKKLKKFNYPFNINKSLKMYLLTKADSNSIEEVVEIINKK